MTEASMSYGLNEQHCELRRLLRLLDQVASDANIEYCCAYGTALGAVRDGDLIPWDTDADVVVPADQIKPLVDALRAATARSDLTVYDCDDPTYDHAFPRIARQDVDQNLLHVDLFPLAATSPKPVIARWHLRIGTLFRVLIMLKRCVPGDRYAHDFRKRIVAKAAKYLLSIVPDGCLVELWNGLILRWPFAQEECTVSVGGPYGSRELMPRSILFPAGRGLLAGQAVAIPSRADAYLRKVYGDYRKLPSDEQQREELRFFEEVKLPKIELCLTNGCVHAEHNRL